MKVNNKGELEVLTEHGPIAFTKPLAYQKIDGKRVEVDVSYSIEKPEVRRNDVTLFIADTGRNTYNDPCGNGNPCNGDFNCDGSVASDDVTKFIEDTGRNTYNNPCPICDPEVPWCVY